MPKTTSPRTFTSALSLLAITMGAVSAALIVMCIGMYFTILSVDDSASVKVHAKAVEATAIVPADTQVLVGFNGKLTYTNAPMINEAGADTHLRDALFREEAEEEMASSAEPRLQQEAPLARTYLATAHLPVQPVHFRAVKRVMA